MGGHNPSTEIEKYDWSKTNVAMFVDIIYEKVKHNKLQTSTFTNTVWEEINKELYQVTNKNYGVERLKSKWNRLRTRQRLFAALLVHTGVTMDPDTDKVNAPEEVWAEFYLKNRKEYKSIRKEGCDHFHILSEIFGRTTATGDMHRASTQLPPTSDEERELEEAFINRGVSSYVEVVDDENEDVGGEPNNRRHRSTESTESHRRKDPKRSKTKKYDAYMDKWSDTLQHLSQESIARQKYLDLRAAKLEREQEISSSTGTSRTLKEMNLLQDGKKVTVEESVAMFLLIIGHNTRHRILHNFIRRHHAMDNLFMEYSSEDMLMSGVEDSFGDQEPIPIDPSQTAQMGHIRDDIASHMWNDYVEHHSLVDYSADSNLALEQQGHHPLGFSIMPSPTSTPGLSIKLDPGFWVLGGEEDPDADPFGLTWMGFWIRVDGAPLLGSALDPLGENDLQLVDSGLQLGSLLDPALNCNCVFSCGSWIRIGIPS
ncbi:hypothetical protein ZIOFF_043760 [Zingiber officinale]|uniref:Myb/SANT-like domain-containing protein n=1 Tax=Zingiber officinale TaxID=94328 RepID=A0A8J5KWM6_ZINOF|nr:hypothetical protein ZIOFF_043760 [Zingiber officinale]